jgi:transcriptional regulator with XRE-family HTH domain
MKERMLNRRKLKASKNLNLKKRLATSVTLEQSLGDALRRLRDKEGISVRELASKCGFSPSFISQVELNQASPSLHSLERIAAGLGVTVGDFFHSAEQSGPEIVRSTSRAVLQSEWSNSQIESLGNLGSGSRIEALLVTIRPKGVSAKRMYPSNTEVFALVLAGSVSIELPGSTQVLQRGDAITLPAGMPHKWENKGNRDVQLLKVISR